MILNDAEVAIELLGKRSALHSSRPNLVMASELSVMINLPQIIGKGEAH